MGGKSSSVLVLSSSSLDGNSPAAMSALHAVKIDHLPTKQARTPHIVGRIRSVASEGEESSVCDMLKQLATVGGDGCALTAEVGACASKLLAPVTVFAKVAHLAETALVSSRRSWPMAARLRIGIDHRQNCP